MRFIEKNTAGVSLGGGGSEYSDPFTGKSFLCACSNVPLTLSAFLKERHDTSRGVVVSRARTSVVTLSPGHRDTSRLRIPQSHRTPEVIPPLGRPDISRRSHHPVPPKADIRIRSRGLIDTNRHLLQDSHRRRPALLRQPQARVKSSLTCVRAFRARWGQLTPFEFQKTPITFKLCNIPAMRIKLTELNNEIQDEIVCSFQRSPVTDLD